MRMTEQRKRLFCHLFFSQGHKKGYFSRKNAVILSCKKSLNLLQDSTIAFYCMV